MELGQKDLGKLLSQVTCRLTPSPGQGMWGILRVLTLSLRVQDPHRDPTRIPLSCDPAGLGPTSPCFWAPAPSASPFHLEPRPGRARQELWDRMRQRSHWNWGQNACGGATHGPGLQGWAVWGSSVPPLAMHHPLNGGSRAETESALGASALST